MENVRYVAWIYSVNFLPSVDRGEGYKNTEILHTSLMDGPFATYDTDTVDTVHVRRRTRLPKKTRSFTKLIKYRWILGQKLIK